MWSKSFKMNWNDRYHFSSTKLNLKKSTNKKSTGQRPVPDDNMEK
jgi:hypothetical protein